MATGALCLHVLEGGVLAALWVEDIKRKEGRVQRGIFHRGTPAECCVPTLL